MLSASSIDPRTPVYLCSHIFANTHPVLYVCKEDGDWQMLCGGSHPADEIPHVVGIGHLFDLDPTLQRIADLADDWEAERSRTDAPWLRKPCDV